jgi:hypothetical protein
MQHRAAVFVPSAARASLAKAAAPPPAERKIAARRSSGISLSIVFSPILVLRDASNMAQKKMRFCLTR